MEGNNVIGAFSEEQASRISGVSIYQLRQWDSEGFFPAAFAAGKQHLPFGRLYSFRDLVSLRVLNDLRNDKKIPLSHLRDVSAKLSHLGDQKWSGTTLYVLGKRVVLEDPATKSREDIVSGQKVFNIPLRVVIKNTRERIKKLNNRDGALGQFTRGKFVSHNELVFSGTRIPVSMVIEFYEAGYSFAKILQEFPDLTETDIEAAVNSHKGRKAA
jgi:DNA-binding transcriptional MerR regulator